MGMGTISPNPPEEFLENFRDHHIDPGAGTPIPGFRFQAGQRGTEVGRAGGLRGAGGEMSLSTRSTSGVGAIEVSDAARSAPWQTTGGGRLPLRGGPDRQEVGAAVIKGMET